MVVLLFLFVVLTFSYPASADCSLNDMALLLFLLVICTFNNEVSADLKYLLVSPSALHVGSTESMTLKLNNVLGKGSATVKLMHSSQLVSMVTIEIDADGFSLSWDKTFDFPVPSNAPIGTSTLSLSIDFDATTTQYTDFSVIYVTQRRNIGFVQTDKTIYKPGETVRTRILLVNPYFRPLTNKTVTITLENPQSTVVNKWTDFLVLTGMAQLEYTLASLTTLGNWQFIVTSVDVPTLFQTFVVAEYVLPKFSVSITSPSIILRNSSFVALKICATYTYGEPVKGILEFNATYRHSPWEPIGAFPVIHKTFLAEGCISTVIQRNELKWNVYPNYYRDLIIQAEFTEEGTEISQSSPVSTITISFYQLTLSIENFDRFYKPSMPYYGLISVKNIDGTPRVNEALEVCVTIDQVFCGNVSTDDSGLGIFTMVVRAGFTSSILISVRAIYASVVYVDGSLVYGVPQAYQTIYQFFSPSHSYIMIQEVFAEVPCEDNTICIKIFTNKRLNPGDIQFQVVSRGNLVPYLDVVHLKANSIDSFKEDSTFIKTNSNSSVQTLIYEVYISPELSPSLHILAYYTTESGELVADSIDIDTTICLLNNAKINFNTTKVRPGSSVDVQVSGSPGSLCGISGVDHSVYLLNAGNPLRPGQIYSIINQYDAQFNVLDLSSICNGSSFVSTSPIPVRTTGFDWWPRWTPAPVYYSDKGDSANAIESGRVVIITNYEVYTKPCTSVYYPPITVPMTIPTFPFPPGTQPGSLPPATLPPATPPPSVPPPGGSTTVQVREDFRELWLWDMVQLDLDGNYDFTSTTPETITQWDANAVCFNDKDGLGIAPTTNLITFKELFASASLSYSVIRGETLLVPVSVFNYYSKSLPVEITIIASPDYDISSNASGVRTCIKSNTAFIAFFFVKPKTLGTINITAQVVVIPNSQLCPGGPFTEYIEGDQIVQSLVVKLEGIPKTDVINHRLCTDNITNTFKYAVNVPKPEVFVPDSLLAAVAVWGQDLSQTLENIDSLTGQPTGCGEQNMIYMAPDAFVYIYLLAKNKLTPELDSLLKDYMSLGYQRELTYRRNDYSFSAFGQSDSSGSIWLTSFVLRVFYYAKAFVFIDWADTLNSANWILSLQYPDGCFPEVGFVIHTELHGGESGAPITAYVLACLLEAKVITNAKAQLAFDCIGSGNLSVYTQALMSFAESLATFETGTTYLSDLLSNAIYNDSQAFYDTGTPSVDLEITAYTVLSLLTKYGTNGLAQAEQFVNWLYAQANPYGGFLTTQGTCVAIHALTLFSQLSTSGPANTRLIISDVAGKQTLEFDINSGTNSALVQTGDLPVLPTVLLIEGFGTGCVFVQVSVTYNIIKILPNASFSFAMTTSRGYQNDCSVALVTTCFKYLGTSDFPGMVLITIRPVSGFTLDLQQAEELLNVPYLNMKKIEAEPHTDSLVFYFSSVSSELIQCFTVILSQTSVVTDLKPGTGIIRSYYNPDLSQEVAYIVSENCYNSTTSTTARVSRVT